MVFPSTAVTSLISASGRPGATVPGQPPGQGQVPSAAADSGSATRSDRWRGLARRSPEIRGGEVHPRRRGVVVLIELHELPRGKPGASLHRDRHRPLHGVSGEIHGRRLVDVGPARRPDDENLFLLGGLIGLLQGGRPRARSAQRDALPDPDIVVDREHARGQPDDLAFGAGVDGGLDARRRLISTAAVGGRIDGRAHLRARGDAAHARCPCGEGGGRDEAGANLGTRGHCRACAQRQNPNDPTHQSLPSDSHVFHHGPEPGG